MPSGERAGGKELEIMKSISTQGGRRLGSFASRRLTSTRDNSAMIFLQSTTFMLLWATALFSLPYLSIPKNLIGPRIQRDTVLVWLFSIVPDQSNRVICFPGAHKFLYVILRYEIDFK
ncbi:hypothetical protein NE237_001858 [Protea cynaroides]|uniref:Uncharacterized protein n=1 Tax=Protea cynaroides TaxID=273540 RepID=A0A9Q0QYS8_9MAGN|nr:hypothetical protein NE237_001858 [Protea cynaroides]